MLSEKLSYRYLVYRHLTAKGKLMDSYAYIYLFVLFFSSFIAVIGSRFL